MNYQQPVPFYMSYPVADVFDSEQNQEREAQIMKSYYSQVTLKIQDKVERECDKMEYEGSIMYDEYPDKLMLEQICIRIGNELQNETGSEEVESQQWDRGYYHRPYRGGFDDLVGILLLNEMQRRRCRHRRCGRPF